ncbi:SPOR domain-containing protein [Psychroflexus aestuariivivens]|uniref:SPOR domain-containing protein n=1 Tax=Psychroflexus aestuariivivens TaxID=1795040 RepID=UPI000FDB633A|nr:SPOR domain-containing protein [Psychroflexus aestuariivivens]
MPVLTEEELQKYKDEVATAEAEAETKEYEVIKLTNAVEDEQNRKKGFMIASIVLLVLFIASVVVFYVVQPDFLGQEEDGIELAEDEQIIKNSEVENYEAQIADLQQQVDNLRQNSSSHPLDTNEFYAVQLGAFKKFNTRLTSESFSIVKNSQYRDFNLYTLGVFNTKEEAKQLLNVVKKMNFKDAFVGYYQNGERTSIVE